jgi:hypothetical protein
MHKLLRTSHGVKVAMKIAHTTASHAIITIVTEQITGMYRVILTAKAATSLTVTTATSMMNTLIMTVLATVILLLQSDMTAGAEVTFITIHANQR